MLEVSEGNLDKVECTSIVEPLMAGPGRWVLIGCSSSLIPSLPHFVSFCPPSCTSVLPHVLLDSPSHTPSCLPGKSGWAPSSCSHDSLESKLNELATSCLMYSINLRLESSGSWLGQMLYIMCVMLTDRSDPLWTFRLSTIQCSNDIHGLFTVFFSITNTAGVLGGPYINIYSDMWGFTPCSMVSTSYRKVSLCLYVCCMQWAFGQQESCYGLRWLFPYHMTKVTILAFLHQKWLLLPWYPTL